MFIKLKKIPFFFSFYFFSLTFSKVLNGRVFLELFIAVSEFCLFIRAFFKTKNLITSCVFILITSSNWQHFSPFGLTSDIQDSSFLIKCQTLACLQFLFTLFFQLYITQLFESFKFLFCQTYSLSSWSDLVFVNYVFPLIPLLLL